MAHNAARRDVIGVNIGEVRGVHVDVCHTVLVVFCAVYGYDHIPRKVCFIYTRFRGDERPWSA